jgi:hypothetical protein
VLLGAVIAGLAATVSVTLPVFVVSAKDVAVTVIV